MKIYFVQNFQMIRALLSVVDLESPGVFVTNGEGSLTDFLKRLAPDFEHIVTPEIAGMLRAPDLRGILPAMLRIYVWRRRHLRKFRGIRAGDAYYFNDYGTVHIYAVLGYLKRRGVRVQFVEQDIGLRSQAREWSRLGPMTRLCLRLLSAAVGDGITIYDSSIRRGNPGRRHSGPVVRELADWPELRRRFDLSRFMEPPPDGAVLFVDDPLQYAYKGIDLEQSRENLVRYFEAELQGGRRVYVKPRPREDYAAEHSLSGTRIEDRLEVVEANFPAELVMDLFDRVVLFYSTAFLAPTRAAKISVFELIVFTDERNARRYREVMMQQLGDTARNVAFVKPETLARLPR